MNSSFHSIIVVYSAVCIDVDHLNAGRTEWKETIVASSLFLCYFDIIYSIIMAVRFIPLLSVSLASCRSVVPWPHIVLLRLLRIEKYTFKIRFSFCRDCRQKRTSSFSPSIHSRVRFYRPIRLN